MHEIQHIKRYLKKKSLSLCPRQSLYGIDEYSIALPAVQSIKEKIGARTWLQRTRDHPRQ